MSTATATSNVVQEIQSMRGQVVSLDDVVTKFIPLDLYRKVYRVAAHSAAVEHARSRQRNNSLQLTDAELRQLTDGIHRMARTLLEV